MSNPSILFVSRRLQAVAAALLCLAAARLVEPPPHAGGDVGSELRGTLRR